MKKICAVVVLVCLLLMPGTGLAAAGDVNLNLADSGETASLACVMGDTLFLCGPGHIFRYRVGDAEPAACSYALPLPEDGEGNVQRSVECMFADGDELFFLVSTTRIDGGTTEVERLQLLPVDASGEQAVFGEPMDVDAGELIVDSYGDDYEYLAPINDACCVNGSLMLFVIGDNGAPGICQLDPESGEASFIEGPEEGDLLGMTPYRDGQLLIQSYDSGSRAALFTAYDPAERQLHSVCEPIPLEDYAYGLPNFVYSAESDRIFYRGNGYVMAMEGFDYAGARPVAELSTMSAGDRAGLLLPGDYYVFFNYDAVSVRSTAAGALSAQRLTVVNSGGYFDGLMEAYYSFGNRHDDVDVVLDNHSRDSATVIESMLNRDDSVDIYTMRVASESYEALYNRGYLAEIDEPSIVEAVSEMYPFLQEVLLRDGRVVAIPVQVSGWTTLLDYGGFAQLGIPAEEVPTSWQELLTLLPTLADRLPGDGSVLAFEEYSDRDSVRYQLYGAVLNAWHTRQLALGEAPGYDDPALLELMEAIRELDLEALGVPEAGDSEAFLPTSDTVDGGEIHRLIQFSGGCTIGNFYSLSDFPLEPTPLSVLAGEEPQVPLDVIVAFINPFSPNPELAQEFLAELLGQLSDATLYNLSDARNEPVRNADCLQAIEDTQAELEELRVRLERAEEIDKPNIEEQIRGDEEYIDNLERYGWDISEEEIEWYRGHVQYMTVERFNYMNASDDNGEVYELQQQLLAGTMQPADFLRELDRKVRMRAMEGI